MTVVVPTGNNEPDTGEQVTTRGPSIKSLAEVAKLTIAPEMSNAFTVILAGNVNVGGVVSTTVTVKLPFTVLLCESVAEQLTVVIPRGNVEPEAGKQATANGPSITSLEEAVKLTGAPEAFNASTVRLAGRASMGKPLSTTVIVKLPFAVLL